MAKFKRFFIFDGDATSEKDFAEIFQPGDSAIEIVKVQKFKVKGDPDGKALVPKAVQS